MRSYKVLFHDGDEAEVSTKASVGRLTLESEDLLVTGQESLVRIPVRSLRSVDLFRFRGMARMLKVSHSGGTLYLSVIRFNLFGALVLVNFFATSRLKQELEDLMLEVPGTSTSIV